jgi:hypothetical protein
MKAPIFSDRRPARNSEASSKAGFLLTLALSAGRSAWFFLVWVGADQHRRQRHLAVLAVGLGVAAELELDAVGRQLRAEGTHVAGGAVGAGLAGEAGHGVGGRGGGEQAEDGQQRGAGAPEGGKGTFHPEMSGFMVILLRISGEKR